VVGDVHEHVRNVIAEVARVQAGGQDERHLEPVVHDRDVDRPVLDEGHGVMRIGFDEMALQARPVGSQPSQGRGNDPAGGCGKCCQCQRPGDRLALILELRLHLLDLTENTASGLRHYPPGGGERRNAAVLLDEHLTDISFEL
jgi:hypothetical protein